MRGTLQTNNTGVCSQCLDHTGFAPAQGVCAFPAHTAQALGCSAGNCPRLALGCMHLPGLSRSGSGTQVVLRGADSIGPAFCALPRSNVDVVWGLPRCVWARESTAPAQGNQSLSRELRASALCPGAQSCLTLCDPLGCSPPGSSDHGIS